MKFAGELFVVLFVVLLAVSRITVYWLSVEKKKQNVVDNVDFKATMIAALNQGLAEQSARLKERDERYEKFALERDKRYLAMYEDLQNKLRGVAEKVGHPIN